MGQSIGSMLADLGALRTQLATPSARSTPVSSASGTGSFAAQLEASFRSRAEQLGLRLPQAQLPSDAPRTTTAAHEDVDAIWKRAQLQSAAFNGPGDAMMQAVADASDARWDQRHHRGAPSLFDM